MSVGTFVKHVEVDTRGNLPPQLEVGTLYFILDESRILIDHGNAVVEYAGTANAVVNSIAGGETQKAPSVQSVAQALDHKADLLNGKILQSQMPPSISLYRGVFASATALNTAFPTDVTGAFATVLATSTMWYHDGTDWVDTGSLGASAIQSINGLVGPDVTLTYDDITPADISDALAGNATLSGTNPVAAQGDLPGLGTESTAGLVKGANTNTNGKISINNDGTMSVNGWDSKENVAKKGVASGYAPLDAQGKVPVANLPDVIDGGDADGI
jgi:hypothetical protein